MMKKILIVCIGNICRSPMAEGLLKKDFPDLRVESAGISALVGQKADVNARELMSEKGINIADHIARQIGKLMVLDADLVLVMDIEQKKYIENQYPFVRGKVFRICESLKIDVPDPFRRDKDFFREALSLLEDGCNSWSERIRKIT